MYDERIQTQAETNKQISGLINEAKGDPKKFLPYGPILMNIYNKELIDVNHSALIRSADDAKKGFCEKQCNGKESCLNKCETFYSWAVNYGLTHFHQVHKYAYIPSVNEEE